MKRKDVKEIKKTSIVCFVGIMLGILFTNLFTFTVSYNLQCGVEDNIVNEAIIKFSYDNLTDNITVESVYFVKIFCDEIANISYEDYFGVKAENYYVFGYKKDNITYSFTLEDICKRILTSRNRIDKNLIKQFELTKQEQKEYDEAIKNKMDMEKRLSEICKKDCLKNGSILQKEEIN